MNQNFETGRIFTADVCLSFTVAFEQAEQFVRSVEIHIPSKLPRSLAPMGLELKVQKLYFYAHNSTRSNRAGATARCVLRCVPHMKQLSKVVWSEGMYLGPYHFQVQNRYFEDSVHFATNALCFATYGVIAFEFDIDA